MLYAARQIVSSVLLPGTAFAGWGLLMEGAGLLHRIARGEQQAFAQCIERYGGMIWGLARRLSATAADAEDATQDVFLHLWRNAKHFDPSRGSEAIFIATLARRTLISLLRSRKNRRLEVSDDGLDLADGACFTEDGAASAEAVLAARALASLPAEQQRVIKLSVVQGLSQSEIAAHTGMPLGTVKTAMRRGLLLVREKLGLQAASASRSAQS